MHGKIGNIILSIVILVLALWPVLIGATASKWVIVVAAALILLKSLCGGNYCDYCGTDLVKSGLRPKRAKAKVSKKKRR